MATPGYFQPRRARGLVPATLATLMLGTALLPGLALADGFTIVDGQTAGQQVLTGSGDVGTIEAGGTISTSGVSAVLMQADDQMLNSAGHIASTGNSVVAIKSEGNNANIVQSGSVNIAGDVSLGLLVEGSSAYLENSGVISADGFGTRAARVNAASTQIVNSGTISIVGTFGEGLGVYADNLILTNTGIIAGDGLITYPVAIYGDNAMVLNKGNISSYGSGGIAIYLYGDEGVIFNSGYIYATGGYAIATVGYSNEIYNTGRIESSAEGAHTLYMSGSSAHITNYGIISSENISSDTHAIYMDATGSIVDNFGIISSKFYAVYFRNGFGTLILEAGSVIDGQLVFSGSGNAIEFKTGLNALVTIDGTAEIIDAGSNAYVQSGNSIAVLDRAGFALEDEMLFALSDGVTSAVGGGDKACVTHEGAATGVDCDVQAWIGGFGGFVSREGTDLLAGTAYGHGGVASGIKLTPGGGVSVGAYVAALSARGDVGTSQDTDISGGALGAHVGFEANGLFADGGLVTAEGDYGAQVFTPVLTAGANLAIGGAVLTPSLRLRYTHATLDGYAETDSDDELVVDERTISELALRAQLALSLTPVLTDNGALTWGFRAGADGRNRDGDSVTANLLGSDVSFDSGSAGESYGGFLGASLDYQLQNGVTLSGDLEYARDNAGARATTARASLSAAF